MRGFRALGRRIALTGSLAAVAALAAAAAPAGATVPAGYDAFETQPVTTHVDFSGAPIPANFFGPGSDAFTGELGLGGEPLVSFMGQDVGDADTIVRRLNDGMLTPPFPDTSNPVPIQIVALQLVGMEPITVTFNGGQSPQLWDVEVTLSPTQPQGQMQITQQNEQGGSFQSQLPVAPRFTFTRLSDGHQVAVNAPPIPFQANNVPWSAGGCKPPALAVPGLNDGPFCPGLTPGGQKQLTVEQAAFASHGIFPAQPRLEHFQCYTVRKARFRARKVTLRDQFGGRRAKISRRSELCNPARKRAEPFVNRRAHLQCYSTTGPAANVPVVVQNQFGSQRLLVKRPQRLCLPSRKRRPRKRFPRLTPKYQIDHYQCYGVARKSGLRRQGRIGRVKLTDQFGGRKVVIGAAFRLCAPASKNGAPIQHPVRHLVCYRFKYRPVRRTFYIANQFEKRKLRTVRPQSLCVPSNKLPPVTIL